MRWNSVLRAGLSPAKLGSGSPTNLIWPSYLWNPPELGRNYRGIIKTSSFGPWMQKTLPKSYVFVTPDYLLSCWIFLLLHTILSLLYCSISFNLKCPVMCDRVLEIMISTSFGIHCDICFLFNQKPDQKIFLGEQCYHRCTSPINKDIEQINVPQYVVL